VSHTNAERASEKKFWRNVGELVDAHLALGGSARLAGGVFDSGQKRGLAPASGALFDGFLAVGPAPSRPALLSLASSFVDRLKGEKVPERERPAFLRQALAADPAGEGVVRLFAADLEGTLARSSELRQGWYGGFRRLQAGRPAARIP